MKCEEFQTHIDDFLKGKIKNTHVTGQFVKHALKCRECYDELEIYYTLHTGLELAEESNTVAMNFPEELKKMLNEFNKGVAISERIRSARNIIYLAANVSMVLTLIIILFKKFLN